LNAILSEAGANLHNRVKDPKDRLDSMRAREIAKEVVEGVKTADDATAFRTWKKRGGAVAFEIVKVLIVLAIGAIAYRYGVKVVGSGG
jgi:hypothetical protein